MVNVGRLFDERAKEFLVRFFPVMAVLYALILLIPLPWLYSGIASLEAGFLNGAGIYSVSDGALIHTGAASFEIVAECSGLVMVAMLIALFYASKTRKWNWLIGGIVFLLLFNLLRLFATLYAGAAFGQGALDVVHPALWFVDAGLVLAVWAKAEGVL